MTSRPRSRPTARETPRPAAGRNRDRTAPCGAWHWRRKIGAPARDETAPRSGRNMTRSWTPQILAAAPSANRNVACYWRDDTTLARGSRADLPHCANTVRSFYFTEIGLEAGYVHSTPLLALADTSVRCDRVARIGVAGVGGTVGTIVSIRLL